PKIAERFPSKKTVVVQNFPVLGELSIDHPIAYLERPPIVTYMGGITRVRGINEIVRAMGMLPNDMKVKLILAGSFDPLQLKDEVSRQHGWEKVEYCGWQSRERLKSILSKTRVGLVVLHPVTNYLESYPVKLFEYMSAGIPVVASDFPLWREIVEGVGCGLLVDPLNPEEIAKAILWLFQHQAEARAMGERGQKAINERYNWAIESKKLLQAYRELME
ncbi:MAG: glycosyltransferase, partial [Dethiobacteria bacterium]